MAGVEDVTPGVQVEGIDEAIGQFAALGAAGTSAFGKISAAAASISNASQGIKALTEGGAEAFEHLATVGAEAFAHILDAAMSGNFTGIVTKMFGEAAGAITETTQKLYEFIEGQAQAIETLSNLADATGMSTGEILGLREAFASVGISTQGFERAIGRLAITIANEWASIQQSVRTSADAQQGAMLQVEQASFNVQKAYSAMGEALSESSRSATHDALAIQEAAMGLRKASQDLNDFALTARSNSLSVESAQLSLIRARMNLQKDQGYAVNPADEKALKLEQDKVAVKEAELRLDEAKNKKAKEGLELEELTFKAKKAKIDFAEAEKKQQDDAAKNSEKIKQAALDEQKSQLARSEASEKQHEQDLKNIPKIAQQIAEVANGQRDWTDVINHTEISAQSLSKSLILAASPGNGEQPKAMEVFKEMSKLFAHMGTDADSMNKKMQIVQHTMGAGFRAGQASAAQVMAVIERGPDAMEKFTKETEAFSSAMGLGKMGPTVTMLKEFNSAASQLAGAWDMVKSAFAAVLSTPLSPFFDALRGSITQSGGTLNTLINAVRGFLSSVLELFTAIAGGIGSALGPALAAAVNIFAQLLNGLKAVIDAVMAMGAAFKQLSGIDTNLAPALLVLGAIGIAFQGIIRSAAILIGTTAAWGAILATITMAVGSIYSFYLLMTGKAKDLEEANKNGIFSAGKAMLSASTMGLTSGSANTGSENVNKILDSISNKLGISLDKAADKTSSSADKLGGAGDKSAQAADKLGGSADKVTSMGSAVQETLSGAGDKLSSAGQALIQAAKEMAATVAAALKPAGAKAGGGKITGPGGPRDDGAGLFALSDGEFVMQSAAVSHYGEGLFDALNNLSVGGFATGGMVGAGTPRAPNVSTSAASGPQSVINLRIGDQEFNGLKAPEHVASKLKSYAVGRQSSSAGIAPSWQR